MAPKPEGPDTIVLIHGLWMTPLSWEKWIERFEARGYKVIAPSWPGFDEAPDALRSHPESVKDTTVEAILDHYERVIRSLDKPPILMGHSFGGSFVQLLIDRGLGAAGVGVASASVRGIRDLPLSTVRSTLGVLANPLNARGKGVPITLKQFQYAFTNNLTEEESQPLYDRFAAPAASKVLFAGALANVAPSTPFKVDFEGGDRAPLLFIGGTDDHVTPGKVVKKIAAKYEKSGRDAEYREFPGRTHYIVGQDGWEEVADFALDWAEQHARPVAAAVPA
jgi:pimeloyl-ACP methyl ester carboxylesterase